MMLTKNIDIIYTIRTHIRCVYGSVLDGHMYMYIIEKSRCLYDYVIGGLAPAHPTISIMCTCITNLFAEKGMMTHLLQQLQLHEQKWAVLDLCMEYHIYSFELSSVEGHSSTG